MENSEVNSSSSAIISRHVDKSQNQIVQYSSKQIWSQQDRQSISECLAQLLLEKDYTLSIARHVRPSILDSLERNAERVKAGGRINHDLHERLCVALSRLLSIIPDAHGFAARYFSSAPPVFQRLFFTSEQSSAVQYGPRRMKLRDLMAATSRFLQSDCAKFRMSWDWSPCVSQLITSDVMVRGFTAQCLALVCHMTDNQKAIFSRKVSSNDEISHMKMKALEENQQLEAEKASVLTNQRSVMWHQELAHKFTRGQVVSEDLSQNVVAVCGVVSPRMVPRQAEQVSSTNVVSVDSTCQNLRRSALAVASHKPVLLEGPIGCGKTTLVEFMAAVTGHANTADILKVQLGDQTDSKMSSGMYRCTDIPGKFVWQPGTSTQAVSKGLWILSEDIDHAPLDVISILLPLMENKRSMIPGREDCIEVASGFQFFATRRMYYSGGNWHKPQNSHAALLDKYWTKSQMGNMTQSESKKVVIHRYPMSTVVSERSSDIYCQSTGERHSELDTSAMQRITDGQKDKPEDRSTSSEGRALSMRDSLKWCERISVNFDSTSSATAQRVFLEALDCFTAMSSLPASRSQMAEIIGSKSNISKEKAQYFCQSYQPGISSTESQAAVGRATSARKQAEAVQSTVQNSNQTFAETRPSAVSSEQSTVCVAKGEPVLSVGETGTGKTSTVQHLAKITGHKLRVVNMNQQSDTADLLGGYKPVDHRQILSPSREAFEELFSQTYSRKQNSTFSGHVQTCFREKRWQDSLRLMDHVCKSASAKELQEKPEDSSLLNQWEALASKSSQTQQQIRACETAMVFAFVEGSLAQAVKKGHWILSDEINSAAAETSECLSGSSEGSAGSSVSSDRGDTEPSVRHPDFRLFACMNPATDVGKRNLPSGLRNRFTESYVHESENEGDSRILVSDYLKCLNPPKSVISGVISFYSAARKEAASHSVDGTGHRPHYSLRTSCRALSYAAANPCHSVQRSLYEGFCMSFLTQSDRSSHPSVQKSVCQHISMGNTKCSKQPIPAPPGQTCVQIEGYWVPQGEMEPASDPSYISTASVKLNLRDSSRVVSAGTHPVSIQGETSVGKTSLIRWLASATGNQCVRINNHEHTDIQEYIGCYSSDERGKSVFKEGVSIDAMRKGYWVISDESNLAPTDVSEALNRSSDDNRESFIAETQEVIKAHPRFMSFATQNPPGLYGGRKVLSRAFRNRFVESHFDELPSGELETILHQRCSLPPSYCTKSVKVMLDSQSLRRGSSVFAGKHGFITSRDSFRWAERYRSEEQVEASQDWLQHLADDGYMSSAGRVRKQEEEAIISSTSQKHFKRTVNPENSFSQKQLSSQFSPLIDRVAGVPEEFRHVVWTHGLRRMAVLIGRASRFGESVSLVGDTGCGKTTICQLYAASAGQKFFSVNCHMHMETSDFLGGSRPVRYTNQTVGEDVRSFEWNDGPLVLAMKKGGVFLMDEISLADDSVSERLNSVSETEKCLVSAEKGSGDDDDVESIKATAGFRSVATMNPGGDFGKKELSPASRNRFTEIWCPQNNSRSDSVQIIQHNSRSGLSLDGVDVAESMSDFIDWSSQQDFGRRCILSVRDILSWVNFLNTVCERDEDSFMTMRAADEEEEAEWDLRSDAVTACVHAACLVYIDGIGSGTTVSCADSASFARQMCLGFSQQRSSKMTKSDQEMSEALRVYDSCLPREPQWGDDFFGISPFYIAIGAETDSRTSSQYAITAGTAAMNAQRLLRALKLQRPVSSEGSPGVGKTSSVAASAKASGNHSVRINSSEQTDVTDSFGTDLPVEGGKGGEFAWRDGPSLAALKAGHWVVSDESNSASQSVLEGSNACFDHRAEIYIPESGMSFQVQHEKTKIFGCQNPFTQGGGRKGLPKSFLNRFTQVFVDQLTYKDMEFIGNSVFPTIDKEIIAKMVEFNNRLFQEVCLERSWGQKGSPWEFNSRDIFRWCQSMQTDQSPGFFNPGQHVSLVYADRMRTEADKAKVSLVFREVFGEDYEPYCGSKVFHITPLNMQVGFSVLRRSGGAPVALDPPSSITHHCLKPLESSMKCVDMGWMTIVVGPTASGKTSSVRSLALSTGHRLRVMAMNSAMDTTESSGGFEQVDIMRPWQQVSETVEYTVAMVIRRGSMSLDDGTQDTEFLSQTWGVFCQWLKEKGLERPGGTVNSEASNKSEVIILLSQKLNTKLKVFTDMTKLQTDFTSSKERSAQSEDGWTNGGFEWSDGMSVQALQAGDWSLMDNVNFCSASVLDRLNALSEPNGSLTINERGVIDGKTPSISPHPNFRSFLTMDPVHGELSRAMRNRGVEVYIPGEHEGMCWDTLDLKTSLHSAGVTGDCVCDLSVQIHKGIRSAIWDSPASSVASLLHAASSSSCQSQRGADLRSASQHACTEAYSFCQRTVANQKEAQQVIEQHLAISDKGDWGDGLSCAGVWPDGFPSALLSTEDSCFSSVLRDGQVLQFCSNSLSSQGKRSRPLRSRDSQQALHSSGVQEDSVFSGGVVDSEDGDSLRLLPTAVRSVTERASHGDWILRNCWLSNSGKSYKYSPDAASVQVEAGNRASKAVFSSNLAVKGKTSAESLQPHSKDEYRILMDMRWNKQYSDILTNKCNFEDEERYMEFSEASNAVANRILSMMDREERAVTSSCTISAAPQSSAMRVATAFSKGAIDISQSPHPMLMHSRSFFDSWDAYVSQAVQNGQPYISDHVMFEISQLLRWRDHFWDVCVMSPADSQGVSVMSSHWQWSQKHLILRLPQSSMGDTGTTLEGQQELQAVSAAIQNVLSTPVSVAAASKGIQRSSGKASPFKSESVAECASRLRSLSKASDVNESKSDASLSCWGQELVRVQGAGLWSDVKESLLEASGSVSSANNQSDPHKSGISEKLISSVEQQQCHMTSKGLSVVRSMSDAEEAVEGGVHMSRAESLQLRGKTQLWPSMEGLSVLNQSRLSSDSLHSALSPGDRNAEDGLRRELSRHLRFCLQSTPMNVEQLQCSWFLSSSDGSPEKSPLVWCESLSEASAALWTCSVTSDLNRWLRWDPVNPETQTGLKSHAGAEKTGPALSGKAVWSRSMSGVSNSCACSGRWEPEAEALLSLSHVSLGEWKERIQQSEVVSSVSWENMAFPAMAHFRDTDLKSQGAVSRRQLQSMADSSPPNSQEGYMESCESSVEASDPLIAAQEIQTLSKNFSPPNLSPEGSTGACTACLQQFVQSKAQGGNSSAQCGVFWVNMGLSQVRVWTPQTIFDPAVKRAYKSNYAQQESASSQDEWKARSLSSESKTGEESKESSTTDGFQHPRIRYSWIRMQQVKEQIAELSRKQAFRPQEPQYGRLFQDSQHYLSSVGHMSVVEESLSQLSKALQEPSSFRSMAAIKAVSKEEAVWQNSQQRFCQKSSEDYPSFPDSVGPVRTGLLQSRHGMRSVAFQVAGSLTPIPGSAKLVSCLSSFPSVSPGLPSDSARAEFSCSRTCMDVSHGLVKLLPQQDPDNVIPQSSTSLSNASLYLRCYTLSTGELSKEACSLFRHICQAVVNEWDNQEKRKQEQEQMEASSYRSRSRSHGSGSTEDEQEEKDFRRQFPQFKEDFADLLSQPSLEGPADTEPDIEEDQALQDAAETSSLSVSAMNTLVQSHQSMCSGYAQSSWYQRTPQTNHSKEHIKASISSLQIASPMMSHFFHLLDSESDLHVTGCGSLLSTLLQNTVRGSGGSDESAISSEGSYDFYHQPNMSEARLCLPVSEQSSEAVKQRSEEWPEHPASVQSTVVMERIMSFNSACPLAKFSNGSEISLGKAQEWENNASRSVSLRKESEPVTQLIIQWRKSESNCWSSSSDNASKRHREKSTKHWFSIYQSVERYLEEQRTEADTGEQIESSSSSSVSSTSEAFMESSTSGEFHIRSRMSLSFHCHLSSVPNLPGQESLSRLSWNLHKYYSQFADSVQAKMIQLRQPIEKELKDFVKISKWNDISYWSIKQSVEKTQRTLFKFVKKFEKASSGPSLASSVEQGNGASSDTEATGTGNSPIQRVHQVSKSSMPGQDRDLQEEDPEEGVEASSLQARSPVLFRKMKKLCIRSLKKDSVPELAEDLDHFTSEIISKLRDSQSLNIDTAAAKEKQKMEVKHILQQKQRALSDLFKMSSELGSSYRKGSTWNRTADPEATLCMHPSEMTAALSTVRNQEPSEHMLFTELMVAWEGCQKYFYRSWARRTASLTAFQQATKELGVGNIERCRGFSSHSFKSLLRQRHRSAKSTEQWVSLRKSTANIQDVKAHSQTHSEDMGCTLPPQDSLHDWFRRGQASSAQGTTLLQQSSWSLQCCPEDPQQREQASGSDRHHTLMCPSPSAVQQQPPGCSSRRGEAAWCQLHQRILGMLKDTESSKEESGSSTSQASDRVLCTWSSFATCCSAMEQLGGVAAQMSSIEGSFSPVIKVARADSQPAISQSSQYFRGQVETCLTEFTTWKTQSLSSGQQPTDRHSAFWTEFSAELEANISAVSHAVQKLVKRREREEETEKPDDPKTEEDNEEPVEDSLKPGHSTRLSEAELEAEVEASSVGSVTVGVTRSSSCSRRHRDSCQPQHLQEVNRACRTLVRFEPSLGVYSDSVRYYSSVSVGVHRSTGKSLSVLSSIFTELAQKGFCSPQESMPGGDGEGATEFHDYEGGGIGEGDGTKDVSDKIENEDQVEDTFQEGAEKEEQQDKENIKSEDNAIEMSEDFDGRVHDGDENEAGEDEESDEEDKEELDKKMGDSGEGQTDTLDERMWGDDEDDEEEGSDKEEESGQGMDQGESESVAKEDNLDSADSNKEKKSQDKDEQICEEETEKIHEQGDEREFDENEVDPYHGQQDKRPEPEAMELPEDSNSDQDEEAGEDEEGDDENPLDIADKAMESEMKEEEQRDGEEGESGKMEENQKDDDDKNNQEPKAEEEDKKGHEREEGEEETADEDEEKEGEENRGEQEEKDNRTIPHDDGDEPKHEDEAENQDEEQPNPAERKEHGADGQTGEENIQSDTAVELAGAASERDQAKEEHGSGAADASQSEGHQSKLTARMASQTRSQSKTQSFKRKPGQADNERSTGDYNERINKRSRTVESSQERSEDRQAEGQQESELYEHIKHGETAYDTQTYDVASAEQQKAAGPAKEQEEDENDDVAMETEDQEEQLQSANVEELKPEQSDTSKSSQKGIESGEAEVQMQDEEDEKKKDRQTPREEERVTRSTESTIHTVPVFSLNSMQKAERDPEESRKEMELQSEAWRNSAPGTQEEEAAAASMWLQYQASTSALSQQLCEQLRLISEPTQAAKLKGDYRTGKRSNMRKVIPYIASQFRKDKIWSRRTKPSKREYQICSAVDDSSSMVDNHSKQSAFESSSVIINALTSSEVGQVSVCSFGEQMQSSHPFQQQFNDESGARILRLCQFQQKKTRIAQFLETSTKMFSSARQQVPGSINSETAQLSLIVSDGRGSFSEGKERVVAAVQAARSANIFVIFVVSDNPNTRDSILDIKVPIFKGPGELPEIRSYMEEFPFPFYVISRDVNALPETSSDALRQWFELITAADQ